MITQIRIDGFKSFVDFKLDVHPRTLLFGVNGAGKSNLFDALRLVAGTVQRGFDSTIAEDPRLAAKGLFHRGERADGDRRQVTSERFTIRIEMLAPSPFGPLPVGVQVKASYEAGEKGRPGRARLGADSPHFLAVLLDPLTLPGLPPKLRAESDAAKRALKRLPESDQHEKIFELVRQETAQWHPKSLGPAPMRGLVAAEADGPLRPNGGNLALVLDRIQQSSPEAFTRLAADLAALVPGARGIRTEFLEKRQQYDFEVEFSRTGWTSPSSLSDGTLRAVALLAAYWDPRGHGLLAVEEIENGMHLTQVAELVQRLSRGTDWSDGVPQHQLLATTHSPALLAALRSDLSGGVVFLEQADRVDPEQGTVSRITTARPLRPRDLDREPGEVMSEQGVSRMLQRLDLEAS
jgi:predicted ATPase